MFGQCLGHLLLGTEFHQQRFLLFGSQRQRHASAGPHGHGLPDRFEIEIRLILQFIHGQEAVPALVVHVETQAGEVRNEALVTHGQHAGIHRQALFHLRRTRRQAEGFGKQFVAIEQRSNGRGRHAARFFRCATLRVVEFRRIGQHHQFVAMGREQQRLARVVVELIERHVVGTDLHVSDLAQLRVAQRHFGQRLQHLGQPAAIHHQQEILEPPIRPAPQRYIGRLIEQLLDQGVLQFQVVFVDDPPQAADQAQAIGVGFVIEDEIFGQGFLEERHRQQVLGQLAQGVGFQ
ncbi:hypothetical protein D3C71_1048340 [compost metagenome]